MNKMYCRIYDAFYFEDTGVWAEEKCNDPDCKVRTDTHPKECACA